MIKNEEEGEEEEDGGNRICARVARPVKSEGYTTGLTPK